MKLSMYLDSIQNTENEELFLQKLSDINKDLAKATSVPFIGKKIRSVIALGNAESIEDFRQTRHYDVIKDWNIYVPDLEKGHIYLNYFPIEAKILLSIFALIALIWVVRRICKKCCELQEYHE